MQIGSQRPIINLFEYSSINKQFYNCKTQQRFTNKNHYYTKRSIGGFEVQTQYTDQSTQVFKFPRQVGSENYNPTGKVQDSEIEADIKQFYGYDDNRQMDEKQKREQDFVQGWSIQQRIQSLLKKKKQIKEEQDKRQALSQINKSKVQARRQLQLELEQRQQGQNSQQESEANLKSEKDRYNQSENFQIQINPDTQQQALEKENSDQQLRQSVFKQSAGDIYETKFRQLQEFKKTEQARIDRESQVQIGDKKFSVRDLQIQKRKLLNNLNAASSKYHYLNNERDLNIQLTRQFNLNRSELPEEVQKKLRNSSDSNDIEHILNQYAKSKTKQQEAQDQQRSGQYSESTFQQQLRNRNVRDIVECFVQFYVDVQENDAVVQRRRLLHIKRPGVPLHIYAAFFKRSNEDLQNAVVDMILNIQMEDFQVKQKRAEAQGESYEEQKRVRDDIKVSTQYIITIKQAIDLAKSYQAEVLLEDPRLKNMAADNTPIPSFQENENQHNAQQDIKPKNEQIAQLLNEKSRLLSEEFLNEKFPPNPNAGMTKIIGLDDGKNIQIPSSGLHYKQIEQLLVSRVSKEDLLKNLFMNYGYFIQAQPVVTQQDIFKLANEYGMKTYEIDLATERKKKEFVIVEQQKLDEEIQRQEKEQIRLDKEMELRQQEQKRNDEIMKVWDAQKQQQQDMEQQKKDEKERQLRERIAMEENERRQKIQRNDSLRNSLQDKYNRKQDDKQLDRQHSDWQLEPYPQYVSKKQKYFQIQDREQDKALQRQTILVKKDETTSILNDQQPQGVVENQDKYEYLIVQKDRKTIIDNQNKINDLDIMKFMDLGIQGQKFSSQFAKLIHNTRPQHRQKLHRSGFLENNESLLDKNIVYYSSYDNSSDCKTLSVSFSEKGTVDYSYSKVGNINSQQYQFTQQDNLKDSFTDSYSSNQSASDASIGGESQHPSTNSSNPESQEKKQAGANLSNTSNVSDKQSQNQASYIHTSKQGSFKEHAKDGQSMEQQSTSTRDAEDVDEENMTLEELYRKSRKVYKDSEEYKNKRNEKKSFKVGGYPTTFLSSKYSDQDLYNYYQSLEGQQDIQNNNEQRYNDNKQRFNQRQQRLNRDYQEFSRLEQKKFEQEKQKEQQVIRQDENFKKNEQVNKNLDNPLLREVSAKRNRSQEFDNYFKQNNQNNFTYAQQYTYQKPQNYQDLSQQNLDNQVDMGNSWKQLQHSMEGNHDLKKASSNKQGNQSIRQQGQDQQNQEDDSLLGLMRQAIKKKQQTRQKQNEVAADGNVNTQRVQQSSQRIQHSSDIKKQPEQEPQKDTQRTDNLQQTNESSLNSLESNNQSSQQDSQFQASKVISKIQQFKQYQQEAYNDPNKIQGKQNLEQSPSVSENLQGKTDIKPNQGFTDEKLTQTIKHIQNQLRQRQQQEQQEQNIGYIQQDTSQIDKTAESLEIEVQTNNQSKHNLQNKLLNTSRVEQDMSTGSTSLDNDLEISDLLKTAENFEDLDDEVGQQIASLSNSIKEDATNVKSEQTDQKMIKELQAKKQRLRDLTLQSIDKLRQTENNHESNHQQKNSGQFNISQPKQRSLMSSFEKYMQNKSQGIGKKQYQVKFANLHDGEHDVKPNNANQNENNVNIKQAEGKQYKPEQQLSQQVNERLAQNNTSESKYNPLNFSQNFKQQPKSAQTQKILESQQTNGSKSNSERFNNYVMHGKIFKGKQSNTSKQKEGIQDKQSQHESNQEGGDDSWKMRRLEKFIIKGPAQKDQDSQQRHNGKQIKQDEIIDKNNTKFQNQMQTNYDEVQGANKQGNIDNVPNSMATNSEDEQFKASARQSQETANPKKVEVGVLTSDNVRKDMQNQQDGKDNAKAQEQLPQNQESEEDQLVNTILNGRKEQLDLEQENLANGRYSSSNQQKFSNVKNLKDDALYKEKLKQVYQNTEIDQPYLQMMQMKRQQSNANGKFNKANNKININGSSYEDFMNGNQKFDKDDISAKQDASNFNISIGEKGSSTSEENHTGDHENQEEDYNIMSYPIYQESNFDIYSDLAESDMGQVNIDDDFGQSYNTTNDQEFSIVSDYDQVYEYDLFQNDRQT